MADAHAEIVEAMGEALNRHYVNLPNSVPVAVPVGKLADAVLERLAEGRQVPKIPAYDDESARQRRWYEPTSHLEQGMPASVGAHREDGQVVIDTYENKEEIAVWLPRQDAIEFALSILAAAGR